MTPPLTKTAPWLALAVAVVGHLALLAVRDSAEIVSGDEGTFLAMAESLALDGDLAFDVEDLARIQNETRPGRRAVILQRTDRIAYSKPALYPFLAAPWFLFGREVGLVGFNVVALAAALFLAYRYLLRVDPESTRPAWAVVTFAGTSVLLSYAAWTMSDSLQTSMTLAGLVLCLAAIRPTTRRDRLAVFLDSSWAPLAGGALLGATVAMRYPNGLIAMAPVAALVLCRRPRRALLAALGVAAALSFGVGLNQWLQGAAVPYKAERATFHPGSGYPAGEYLDEVAEHWVAARATERMGIEPVAWEPIVSTYAAGYYLIGRHTGLLFYFPAALILAAAALRRRDRVGWVLLAAVGGMVLFYLLWMPRNYFGGATFLGNRYFLTGYAALLLAPRRLPAPRVLALVWALSSVAFTSAVVSSSRHQDLEEPSQSHAYAGVFRYLPYESTAVSLDGRRDRYWSDELVRFVDPFPHVEDHGFRLVAGRPGAEVLIASGREHRWIRFLVQADRPEMQIVYRDWRHSRTVALEPDGDGGSWGLVEIEASPPWRRHPFWWAPRVRVGAWVFRLQLVGPEGASAEVRYLGPYRLVEKFYAAASVDQLRLPATVEAGATSRVNARAVNRGWRPWATESPIPIHLGYRLRPLSVPGGLERTGPFVPVEEVVPGGELDGELEIRWPRRPGRYEVVIDLAVAGRLWFAQWVGEPLAVFEVEVKPTETTRVESRPGSVVD